MSPIDVEGRVLFAEVLRPDDSAAEVERGDLAGAEPDEETLPVGDGRGTREVVLFVEIGEWTPRLDTVFPEAAAVSLVEGFDDEDDRLGAASWAVATATDRLLERGQRGVVAGQLRMRSASHRRTAHL